MTAMTAGRIRPEALKRCIRERRSIRRYLAKPMPRAALEDLLEAATWAPSAHNRQPWRFVVIEAAPAKERLALAMGERLRQDLARDGLSQALIEKDATRSYQRITGAAALILLCLSLEDMDDYPDARRSASEHVMAIQSAAMAGQNILLLASAMGFGACWMCAPLFCPDVVREALNLFADWQPQGMITLGYPAEERSRHRDSWEQATLWR